MARNTSLFSVTSMLGVGALALAGAAVIVNRQTANAEKAYPPKGRFVTVEGIRLHFIERGEGPPVIFLHGNGMTTEDMLISGVLDVTAQRSFRAIAIDRQTRLWP